MKEGRRTKEESTNVIGYLILIDGEIPADNAYHTNLPDAKNEVESLVEDGDLDEHVEIQIHEVRAIPATCAEIIPSVQWSK